MKFPSSRDFDIIVSSINKGKHKMRFICGVIVGIILTLYLIEKLSTETTNTSSAEQEMRLKYIPDSWKSTVRNTLKDRNK